MKRRSVALSDEAFETIQVYRAKFFAKGVNKSFNDALNELVLLEAKEMKKNG